ncbi:hypothetical protein TorRG33x02_354930 [Trema orientale]|uniref:Transmembrane protein n=1 Tax=Trema orientale TaxID=63057 RepID=A0A2P5AA99_TREOI|nr:hypothetical protein TorRG33x02_354930 [Trema orientale]
MAFNIKVFMALLLVAVLATIAHATTFQSNYQPRPPSNSCPNDRSGSRTVEYY